MLLYNYCILRLYVGQEAAMEPFTFLVLTVCTLSMPTTCREERLSFQVGIAECTAHALPHIAMWQMMHPKLVVKKWRCAPPEYDI
jgi:hypothetical protein